MAAFVLEDHLYSSPPKAQLHEQYGGSAWTEVNDLNNGHSRG